MGVPSGQKTPTVTPVVAVMDDEVVQTAEVVQLPANGAMLQEAFEAAQYGNFDNLRQLVDSGYKVDTCDGEGITAMHWAAINKRSEIVQYLVDCGAKLDLRGGNLGATPVYWATTQGHISIVHQLAEAQTDLATVRDAIEATDEALARKEQESAYMVDGEM